MKKEKEVRLKEANISLVLDSYDDIFSDFDPREYSERSLSFDLLEECKRVARDKGEGIELRLLVPKQKRNAEDELKIKKRLMSHFQRHFNQEKNAIKKMRREGMVWFFIGFILMAVATLLLYKPNNLLWKFLFIIFEPAGWFMFWEGLVKALIAPKEKTLDYQFYNKMRNAHILFLNY